MRGSQIILKLCIYLFRPQSCFPAQYLPAIELEIEAADDLPGTVLVDFMPTGVSPCRSAGNVIQPRSVTVIEIPRVEVGYDEPVTLLVKIGDCLIGP